MPTPLQILLDPVSLIVLAMYASLMVWEGLAPGRTLTIVRYWKLRGVAAFIAFFYLSSYLPLLWDQHLARYQLFDLTGLGTFGSVVVGLLIYELGAYWWHRSMHHGNSIHRYNYADLPVFDMLFGTFRNPRDFEVETGFYPGASAHVTDMLLFKDVNRDEKPAVVATQS